jgi:hypothetical protein
MTFHEPNPDVRDTGVEAGEFLDDGPQSVGEDEGGDDPTERRSGTPPLEPG